MRQYISMFIILSLLAALLGYLTNNINKELKIPKYIGFISIALTILLLSEFSAGIQSGGDGTSSGLIIGTIIYALILTTFFAYISYMILADKHIPKLVSIIPAVLLSILGIFIILGIMAMISR